uniref:Sodium:calcium antiporter n=1 Tax=Schlesneria paludicola TaxID=360056 RepID=A0A7C2JWS2_9PLAN
MTAALVQFAVSAAIIVFAGTYLARYADQIAERTGFGRLLVGSILLAGATSLPELTVDLSAVRMGMPDLAVGDLLGSSLFNLLILAILDLLSNTRGRMFSREAAGHALSGNVSAALTAMVALCLLAAPVTASREWLGVSYGLWFVVLGYALGVRMVFFDQQMATEAAAAVEMMAPEEGQIRSLGRPATGFALAALAIIIAGPYLSDAAGKIADASGLGKTFVGTTLVAFSTSLPELVSSLAALRLGSQDLAIGNIFGSNAFNMILLAPLDLMHPGPLLSAVSAGHSVTALGAITATLIVVLGQLYHVERRQVIIEPDAWLVLIVIFGVLGIVYRLG